MRKKTKTLNQKEIKKRVNKLAPKYISNYHLNHHLYYHLKYSLRFTMVGHQMVFQSTIIAKALCLKVTLCLVRLNVNTIT